MTVLLDSSVRTARAADRPHLFDTLAAAFASDPAVRWMYPHPEQYRNHFPEFAQAFAGQAFDCGSAWYSDDGAGVALWLPPGVAPDEEALVSLLEQTVREADQEAVFAVFEEMGSYHPSEPHWYLPLIGVVPSQQGRGCGSELMRHALVGCDRERRLAYLESSNPRNVPLYQRHGFEVLGTIQVGSSPPIFPMLRAPR